MKKREKYLIWLELVRGHGIYIRKKQLAIMEMLQQ